MRLLVILPVAATAAFVGLARDVAAFSTTTGTAYRRQSLSSSSLEASISQMPQDLQDNINADFWLSPEEVNAVVTLGKEPKTKSINPFGFWAMAVSLVVCPVWYMALQLCAASYKINDEWDPNREFYDGLGKIWAKAFLGATGSYPTYSGELELLRKGPHNKPCLFVANHASWLDIPVLCTCTDQVFKFVSKAELGKLPCIGDQLTGGNHILIDRDNRRSQLRSFKESIAWIKKGVPLVAFPEGRRSDDGRLLDFKGGLFAIASKTKVPIVPITLSHTHAVMPASSLFPVQPGAGKLHVHVHPAIDVEGKSEEELGRLVREAFFETLPTYQHPAPKEETLEGSATNEKTLQVS